MKTKKILFGGISGGIALFFLGWLIWGLLLAGYMASNCNQHAMRMMDDYIWSALILANLGWAFLLAIVFSWSDISGWKAGAQRGAVLGLLTGLSIDLGNYAMSTMYSNLGAVAVDTAANVAWFSIGGAIIAWAMDTVKE